MITERELATILAALRYWQAPAHSESMENDLECHAIATDEGQFIPLDEDEIDVLAERLNFGDIT